MDMISVKNITDHSVIIDNYILPGGPITLPPDSTITFKFTTASLGPAESLVADLMRLVQRRQLLIVDKEEIEYNPPKAYPSCYPTLSQEIAKLLV